MIHINQNIKLIYLLPQNYFTIQLRLKYLHDTHHQNITTLFYYKISLIKIQNYKKHRTNPDATNESCPDVSVTKLQAT